MRKNVRALVELLFRELSLSGPVVEVGAYRVERQESLADLGPVIGGLPRVGLDLRAGPGVDVVADGSRLPLPDGCAPTVLSLETLEHAPDPRSLAHEAHRVCAEGGVAVLTTVLDFRIHAHPDDYWRMTPSCMALLLEPFATRVVGFQGHPKFPHSVFGIGIKEGAGAPAVTRDRVAEWQSRLGPEAAFQKGLLERTRIALASLFHSRALRGYRAYDHLELMLIE